MKSKNKAKSRNSAREWAKNNSGSKNSGCHNENNAR